MSGAERARLSLALGGDPAGLGGAIERAERGHDVLAPGNRRGVEHAHRLEVLADRDQVLGSALELPAS